MSYFKRNFYRIHQPEYRTRMCWTCFHKMRTEKRLYPGYINLICDTCKRYYCSNCWCDAGADKKENWKPKDDFLYHISDHCDNCLFDECKIGGGHDPFCQRCKSKEEYFKKF